MPRLFAPLPACLFVAVLGFAVYANSIHGEFVYDDIELVRDNPALEAPFELASLNQNVSADRGIKTFFFRPLLSLSYAVDRHFWGRDVFGYHLSSVFWHVAAALALYGLMTLLYRERIAAFFASLLFVLHPVHTEAVAYISGRADPLCLFFILAALIFYVRIFEKKGPVALNTGLTWLFFGAALLSKEHALIFLALAGSYNLLFDKRLKLGPTLLVMAVTGLYLFFRLEDYRLLGAVHPYKSVFLARFPGVFASLAEYVRLLVLPVGLHMEYGMKFFRWWDAQVLAGLVLFFFMLNVLYLRRYQPEISFPLVWFIAALLPVSNLFPLNASMAEHWLYLPSAGIFMAASLAWACLVRSKYRRVALGAALVVALLLGFLTVRQNRTWQDAVGFYERTLRFAPEAARIYNNLGSALQERGRMEEATRAMEKAVELNPQASESQYNLGNLYALQEKYDEAKASYHKAIGINPQYYLAYYNLGVIHDAMEQDDFALVFYKRALEINPRYEKALDALQKLSHEK